jgi:hypothetical protein
VTTYAFNCCGDPAVPATGYIRVVLARRTASILGCGGKGLTRLVLQWHNERPISLTLIDLRIVDEAHFGLTIDED